MTFTIDGERFARDRASVEGELEAADAPRLVASGVLGGRVEWRLRGIETARGKAGIRVEAVGLLELECQRCLEPVVHPVEVAVELEFAADQESVDSADDEVDRIVVSRAMDAVGMVEDEVLLGLPMVPRHESCTGRANREVRESRLGALLEEWAPRGRKH